MADIDLLFDIHCEGRKQSSKIKELYGLKMTKKDFNFYVDQKTERKQKCLNLVEACQPSNKVL